MKLFFLLIVILGAVQLFAAELSAPREYLCCRTTDAKMQIDGIITDAEWADAPWTNGFVDIVGKPSSPKPQFLTRARMLWSDTHLYVAAHLDETNIAAGLTDHDAALYTENAFELFIDPDGDNQNYCEFEINARNIVMDLSMNKPYRDHGKPDLSFELKGLKTAVHIDGTLNQPGDTDRGWDIEIAIPFASLAPIGKPAAPEAGERWRLNFARAEHEKKASHYSVWSPQGEVNMHAPERFGYVQFTTAAGEGKFVPDPTAGARDELMRLYHAQRVYRQKNKRWAATLDELGFKADGFAIELTPVTDGWDASTTVSAGSKNLEVHVEQDSHLRVLVR